MKRLKAEQKLLAVVAGLLIGLSACGSRTETAAEEQHEHETRARLAQLGLQVPRASTAGTPVSTAPVVRWAAARGESKPFAQLAPGVPSFNSGELEEHEIGVLREPKPRAPGLRDPLLQATMPKAAAPAPLATFEGISQPEACGGCIPPDTTGAVGPTQYVQMVNEHLAVFNKADGQLQGSVRGIKTLFAGLPDTAVCHNRNDGDPVVIYDQLADRWMLSQFAVPGGADGYHECIAVSKTGDATGEYWLYDFLLGDANHFHDYPHLGLWPDAYYMSTHVFDSSALGAGAFAFEREKMLQGLPARSIYFAMYAANASFWGHLPATLDGATPPPAGAPGLFVEVDASGEVDNQDAMRIWRFHADWTNPAASTFGLNSQPNFKLPVAAFSRPLCGILPQTLAGCVPQPTSWVQLDSIGDRLMFRAAYRNFGDHESLVLNHTVEADSTTMQAGPRWYEVRNLSTTPTLYQQGTFAPTGPTDPLYRWMGSIAMDHMGNIGLGYSTSSNANFPSIAYAGRLADDPLGQLTQGETQMFAGGGSQNPYGFVGVTTAMIRTGRWGDYSTMTVDPADDCTFWFTTEYFPSVVDDPASHVFTEWHTRFGSFKYPNCVSSGGATNHAPLASLGATPTGGRPPLTVSFTVNASDPDAGDTLSYTLDFGDGSAPATGGAASGQLVSHAYTAQGAFTAQLTVSDGKMSAISTQVITVANPGSGPTCSVPGVEVVRDNNTFIIVPTDVAPSPPAGSGLDIGSIWMAEPYEGASQQRIAISLGVNFAPADLPTGAYYVFFNTADGVKHWVYYDVNSKLTGVGTPFTIGHEAVNATTGATNEVPDGPADADSFVDTANGRIVWYVTKSKIPALATSPVLDNVNATSYIHVGIDSVIGGLIQDMDFTDTGSYTQAGNAACAPPVNHAPVASLAPASATITAGGSVDFTVSGSDVDNDTLTYDLDFGDGKAHATANGVVPHVYDAAGTYTARLSVADGHGGTDRKSATITVNPAAVNHDPSASLTPASTSIHAGESVAFQVSGSDVDGDTLSYDLDFGDGTPHGTTSGTVGHPYGATGTYTATLTVSDGRGGSGTATSTVTVTAANGNALGVTLSSDRTSGDVSNGPVLVTFTAAVSNDDGTPLQYTFAFGDGSNSYVTTNATTVTHEYPYAGTYHPYVTAVQDYGSRAAASGLDSDVITLTTQVSVSGGAAAHLTYDLPNGAVAPVDVVFDTSGSTGAHYSLVFGDGGIADADGTPPASITHRYNAPGTYTATLTMTDGNGGSVSQSQTILIKAHQELTAQLMLSTSGGAAPLTVQLDGCHSIPGNGQHIVSYTMDFDDGSALETKAVDATHVVDCSGADRSSDPSLFTHVYTKAGTYLPTLTVTDDSSTPQVSQAKALSGVNVLKAPAAGGGGGGAFGFLTLLPLFAAVGLRRRKAG